MEFDYSDLDNRIILIKLKLIFPTRLLGDGVSSVV